MLSKVLPVVAPAVYSVFGFVELSKSEYDDAMKNAKDFVRDLDKALHGDWLVGNHPTVADFCVGLLLAPLFQTLLDAGFRKAAPKTSAWFERVIKLSSVVKTHGHIKPCARALKPLIKAEEKKVVAAPKPAAKPKKDEEESYEDKPAGKNPLDCLPESKFDLFNFKTFFVNHPDKSGEAVDELLKQFDE